MPLIDDTTLNDLIARARRSPRRRMNLNLHPTPEDAVNRLANAVEPDSYIRPHRHPDKWELLLPVRGAFDVLFFDDAGQVTTRHQLGGPGGLAALEYAPGTWHTLRARESGSVFFEVKQGPYVPTSAAEFAPWSPAEGDAACARLLAFMQVAQAGDVFGGSGER